MAESILLGPKVRRLRRHHGLTQVQLAKRLGISASYLALIESNQRPLTVPLLLKLGREFELDLEDFTGEEDGRLVGELSEVFAESMFDEHDIEERDLRQLVMESPQVARAVLELHKAWRRSRENVDTLALRVQD
jgi:XRE family transcriptional regulator, fatty acid utilization regulator